MVLVLNDAGKVTERELYAPEVDAILASEVVSPTSEGVGGGQDKGTVNWMLGDNQGTIRDVVQAQMSGGGVVNTNVVDHVIYSAYGVPEQGAAYSSDPLPRFGFDGMRYDQATGLNTAEYRVYDPATGGWLSQDPLGFGGGDTNTARFVANSPTNFTDPTGLALGDYLPPSWLSQNPLDIPAVLLRALFSGGGSMPDQGCGCCAGGGFNNPSVATSLGGGLTLQSPQQYAGANTASSMVLNVSDLPGTGTGSNSQDKLSKQIKAIGKIDSNPDEYPPTDPEQLLRLSLTSTAGGRTPSNEEFWTAVRYVQSLFPKNTSHNGMLFVSYLRQFMGHLGMGALDNDLLASVDHYFYARWITESGCPAVGTADLVVGYDTLKRQLPKLVPRTGPTPPSPPSNLQYNAGIWGARDAVSGETGGKVHWDFFLYFFLPFGGGPNDKE